MRPLENAQKGLEHGFCNRQRLQIGRKISPVSYGVQANVCSFILGLDTMAPD